MSGIRKRKKISIFNIIITIFFLFLVSTMIIPILNAFALSFSTDMNSMVPEVVIWPKEFSVQAYKTLFREIKIAQPLINNMIVTLGGTILHIFFCTITGYALAQRELKIGKAYMIFIMITMMVPLQNIMIPTYILYKDLKLVNSLWSIIISGMVTGYTVILLKNFFQSIPDSLRESAKIDGAKEFTMLFKIYLPLSKPGLATVILFQFVDKWNHFMEAVLFLNDPEKYTLQISLRSLLLENDTSSSIVFLTKNTQMAGVVIAIMPLLIIYPFLQKYFISGLMIGATKG